jgi:hypothetical protein
MIKLFNLNFKADKVSSVGGRKVFVCINHPFIQITFDDDQGSLDICVYNGFHTECICYISTDIYRNPKLHKDFQKIINNHIEEISRSLNDKLIMSNIKANFFNDIKDTLKVIDILK